MLASSRTPGQPPEHRQAVEDRHERPAVHRPLRDPQQRMSRGRFAVGSPAPERIEDESRDQVALGPQPRLREDGVTTATIMRSKAGDERAIALDLSRQSTERQPPPPPRRASSGRPRTDRSTTRFVATDECHRHHDVEAEDDRPPVPPPRATRASEPGRRRWQRTPGFAAGGWIRAARGSRSRTASPRSRTPATALRCRPVDASRTALAAW